MRFKSMTTLLMLLALLAFDAQAFDDSTGKSADELLNNSGETFERADERFPGTPAESRAIREGTSKTGATPMPSKLSSIGASSPKDARNEAGSAASTPQQEAATLQGSGDKVDMDLSGMWTLMLGDARAEVRLFQNQGVIFGTGNLMDGDVARVITASGDLTGRSLNLDMVTLGSVSLYRLDLIPSVDSVSGSYSRYSSSGSPISGGVSGTRRLAAE